MLSILKFDDPDTLKVLRSTSSFAIISHVFSLEYQPYVAFAKEITR